MSNIEEHKATALKFFEAMAAVDFATLAKYLAPDFVLETTGSCCLSGVRSGAEITKMFEFVSSVLPRGVRFQQLSITAEGDRVAYQAAGTGTTASGESYNNQYLFLLTFRDGKIVRLTEYLDTRLTDDRFRRPYNEWLAKS